MAGRIVVGVDPSDNAATALRWAAQEAELRGATLEVVHAWDYPYIDRLGPEVRAELEANARRDLDHIVDRVLSPEAASAVTRTVVCGSPAAALIDTSTDAELLVVGTRGHGGFGGMVLGSVSAHCAHYARCPLVIVPPHSVA